MPEPVTQCCDCAVIGGGPGGLTAALYLARFNRTVLVFDGGPSRAQWSPWNHNYPGFPEGISGGELLERFRTQADAFNVEFVSERVTCLELANAGFCVRTEGRAVEARKVVLATGVKDVWPDVPDSERVEGKHIRVCPICDAHEVTDRRAGLIGCGDKVAREALYLHHFTSNVVLFTNGLDDRSPICDELTDRLCECGVQVVGELIDRILPEGECGARVCLRDGEERSVDLLFSALGVRVNNELARGLEVKLDPDGYIPTDHWQETSVRGLYAVGDITSAINQVTVAVGQGALAATAIHNSLLDF